MAHGGAIQYPWPTYENETRVYINTLDHQEDYIESSEFCDKLESLESHNIIVIVESCDSGDFVLEYQKGSRSNEEVLMIGTSYSFLKIEDQT